MSAAARDPIVASPLMDPTAMVNDPDDELAVAIRAEQAAEPHRRAAFIQALRDCATFLETHPAVRAPRYMVMNVFAHSRAEVQQQARAASWEKDFNGAWFNLVKRFGEDLRLDISAARETVCRRVVTGTHVEPAEPARTVEDVEWVCEESLLGGDQ